MRAKGGGGGRQRGGGLWGGSVGQVGTMWGEGRKSPPRVEIFVYGVGGGHVSWLKKIFASCGKFSSALPLQKRRLGDLVAVVAAMLFERYEVLGVLVTEGTVTMHRAMCHLQARLHLLYGSRDVWPTPCRGVVVYHTLEPQLVMQQAFPPTVPPHPLEPHMAPLEMRAIKPTQCPPCCHISIHVVNPHVRP